MYKYLYVNTYIYIYIYIALVEPHRTSSMVGFPVTSRLPLAHGLKGKTPMQYAASRL